MKSSSPSFQRLKLALFMPNLAGGGAEMVMLGLARGFVDKGFLVDLVVASAQGPCLDMLPPNVRLIDLKVNRTLKSLIPLARYLRRERPASVLSTLQHANLVAYCAHRLAFAPSTLCVRETIDPSAVPAWSGGFMPYIRNQLTRYCYSGATFVVAPSNGVAASLSDCYRLNRNSIKVIYNPVNIDELLAKSREPADHPWLLPSNIPLILGVGRLTAAKDFATLIEAFRLVRREHEVRLIILGEGEERANLEKLVEHYGLQAFVDMPGFVQNPMPYMSTASVYVLSSTREGMPNAMLQALALGCRIVATDCPSGPREILEGRGTGKLVPMGSETLMARAISDSLDMESRQSPRLKLEEFSCESIVDQYLELMTGEHPLG